MFNKTPDYAMEREIYEQPSVLRRLIATYVTSKNDILINIPRNIRKAVFIGSGSSYNAGLIAAELIRTRFGSDVQYFYSGEFFLSSKKDITDTLFIFLSQSGETS